MIAIRCTQKLLARIGAPCAVTRPTTTLLGDWYARPVSLFDPARGHHEVPASGDVPWCAVAHTTSESATSDILPTRLDETRGVTLDHELLCSD